ncbi:MAG: hypothetical protein JXN59_11940 [Anaerolineae bacterium]|nr:hypothetical protein [Anaerolineae bacterium]
MESQSFLTAVNLIFGAFFLFVSWRALRLAFPLIRVGWQAIDAAVQRPGYREHPKSRRIISEGGQFLIGGIIRLLLGIFGAGLGLYLVLRAIFNP